MDASKELEKHIVLDENILHRLFEDDIKSNEIAQLLLQNLIDDDELKIVVGPCRWEIIGKYRAIEEKYDTNFDNILDDKIRGIVKIAYRLYYDFLVQTPNSEIYVEYPSLSEDELLDYCRKKDINSEDAIWIDLAVSSKDHIITSGDSDFTDNKDDLKKDYDITVYAPEEFVNEFCPN